MFIAVRLSRVVRGVLALAELRVFNPSNVRGCCLRYRELLTMSSYEHAVWPKHRVRSNPCASSKFKKSKL